MPARRQKTGYLTEVPRLTALGFVVIPLNNKQPILARWNKLTTTPKLLAVFQGRNYGVVTGRASAITILDIDARSEGMRVWKALSSAYPEIYTPTVRTPSGGLQLYFTFNKNINSFSQLRLRGKTLSWNVLNDDRQAVLPPSIDSASKKRYKWLVSPDDADFARMPDWLERYLGMMKFGQPKA